MRNRLDEVLLQQLINNRHTTLLHFVTMRNRLDGVFVQQVIHNMPMHQSVHCITSDSLVKSFHKHVKILDIRLGA